MSELDVDESRLHQGAASQAPALYSLQSHNVTPRHLIIETDTSCSPAVIESIPMMPKFRTDIASLPIEMLLHILKLYYLYFWDDPPNGTVKDLQWWLILNVCSTWRQLVLDTPFFWQKIWSHWHPEIVNLFEMRSKPYSLTIRRSPLGGPGFGDQNYDVEGNATARLLTTHMDRIRSLDIEWLETLWLADVNTHEKMYNLISRCVADAAFPKLTEVFLGSCTYYRAKRSMKLNAPKLKFLILQELVLDLTCYPYLANLTSLRLRTANLTAEDIIPLVEACPRLEYCNIRTEQKTTHHLLPEPQPLPTHRVPLRALEYLNISGLQWLSLARTLDHLEICPTANINLKLPPAERHGDHPQDVFRETITPFIPSYDSLEISGHAIMLRNSARPGSLAFNSDDSDHSVLASLSEKLTYFSLPNVGIHISSISIAKIGADQVPEIDDIRSAFSGFPSLEVLSLRECKDINNFLSAFQHNATMVVCPRLRRFDLQDSHYKPEILLGFLEERNANDALLSIEWLRLVQGLFTEKILSDLRAYVGVLVEEPPKEMDR